MTQALPQYLDTPQALSHYLDDMLAKYNNEAFALIKVFLKLK